MKTIAESVIATLRTEADGLAAATDAIRREDGRSFVAAVELLLEIGGRLIVTGVGKSGHIGAKLAATFASTGTPAFFVHPAEAGHGDLGMIGRDDAILAISKSGESTELQSIIAYAARFSIPIIALTARPESTLGQAASVVLTLPEADEACPNGLAPTTSTLLQLAYGDALAVALLEQRGFTSDDFRVFHPGGRLGAALTRLGEIMHGTDSLPLVPSFTPLPRGIVMLSEKRFGCVGVTDADGRLLGVVTDGDLARNLARPLPDLVIDDIMTRDPRVAKVTDLAGGALERMERRKISALFVIDEDGRPVGIVHIHDLLRIGAA